MAIAAQKVVTIDYTLTNDAGDVIDKSADGQFAYLHGASNIIPGLESALEGKDVGAEMKVALTPAEGYGERNDALTQEVPKEMFGDADPQPGQQFHAQSPDGQALMVTVVKVEGDNVTVDGNHPLAGVNLNFDVKVVDVRDASEEELAHGHPHGPEGHDH